MAHQSRQHLSSSMISEDDSIMQLKHQLAEKQQLRIDNERKDLLISDLRNQNAELLKFKEQVYNLRAQLAVTEERAKIREQDGVQRQREQMEQIRRYEERENALRLQLLQLQEGHAEQSKTLMTQLSAMESQVAALRAELDRKDIARQRLEHEVASLAKDTHVSQKMATDRESSLQAQLRQLQDQCSLLDSERQDLEQMLAARNATTDQQKHEIQALEEALSLARRDRDALNRAKLEQAEALARLQTQLNEAQENLREARADAVLVPDLRREVANANAAQHEFRTAQARITELVNTLDAEKNARRLLEEEKKQLETANQSLTRHLSEMRSMLSPRSELSEKRRQAEALMKEVDRCRGSIASLQDEVAQARQHVRDMEGKFDTSTNELTVAISALQRMVESVLAGGDVPPTELTLMLPNMEALRPVLTSLKTRLADALSELADIREQQRTFQADLLSARAAIEAKELDRVETHRHAQDLQRALSEQQQHNRSLQQEHTALDLELRDTKQQLQELEENVELRTNFIAAVCRQLEAGTVTSGSPSKTPHRHDRPSWPALQSVLSELTSQAAAERESLRRVRNELTDKLREAEERLAATQTQLSEAWHTNTKLQAEIESDYQQRLDEVRRNADQLREQLMADAQQHYQAAESELKLVKQESMSYESEVKRLEQQLVDAQQSLEQAETRADRLFESARLLARFVRPMRLRVKELREQKMFLSKRYRRVERLQRDIMDLMQAMTGEFQSPQAAPVQPKRKVTFRVAAIYIIAANRLRNMLRTRSFMGVPVRFGREVLYLANPSVMASEQDIPPLPQGDDAFYSVVRHMDPTCEYAPETMFSRALLDGLGRGLREWKWNQQKSRPQQEELSGEQALIVLRKTTLSLTKRLHELEAERGELLTDLAEQRADFAKLSTAHQECEAMLMKTKELNGFLEQRIQQADSEMLHMVKPERFESLRKELENTIAQVEEVAKERDALRHELSAQMTALQEMRTTQQKLLEQAQAKNNDIELLQRTAKDKESELEDMRQYLKRKTNELASADEERRSLTTRLRDAQASMDGIVGERQRLQQRLRQVEEELATKTELVSKMESNIIAFERHRQNDEEARRQQAAELQRKERELASCQELIKALTEAHQRAADRTADLESQLASTRHHIQSLKNELLQNADREEAERRDREEWARQRLELLTARAAADAYPRNSPPVRADADLSHRSEAHHFRQRPL